ncbi:MAG TPA: RyR domain-containing protein [Blastocatellia bacterium]|nr:RyR domain-containing protein [Blastocatellia bacterium]
MYEPKPIDTSQVRLPDEINELAEHLAESTHDNWSLGRMREGWTYGPTRNDELKQHPGLVPYDELSEGEKQYDRVTAMETLKAIYALGYRIVRA